jgi:hypothetical protein
MSPSSACSQLHSRCEDDLQIAFRQQGSLDPRQRGRLRPLAHIDPDQAVALGNLVGLGFDFLRVVLTRRCVRHIDTITRGVELPAVIDAADAVLLVAPEEQGGAAMWAAVIQDPDPAGAVAERDQPFAEQHQPHRRAVALQLRRHRRRNPVLPHHFAHHSAGPDTEEVFAVLLFTHH